MRIGLDFLSDSYETSSGTVTYLNGFMKALSSIDDGGNEYYLFVNSGNIKLFEHFKSPKFHVVHFPFSNKKRELRVLSQLCMVPYHARRLRLDAVDFFGTTGVGCLPCASVQHVKTLHHILVPGHLDRYTSLFRTWAVRVSIRQADVVVANSLFTSESIMKFIGATDDRVLIVPEAVDTDTFYPIRSQDDSYQDTLIRLGIEKPYILFVSTLWPYKNAEVLIKAYAHLMSGSKLPHKLIIVGGDWKGELSRIQHVSQKLRVSECVRFTGHISDRGMIRDLYVGSDVFVYPSLSETFGLTLLEAMACGVPVVASNRTCIPETADNAAIIVDADNIKELAEAIFNVVQNHELKKHLIQRGLQRANQFTWQNTVLGTLRAWQKAVEIHDRR